MSDIKNRLSNAPWRLYKPATVEVDGESLPVVLRRPPPGVTVQVLDEAREAGDVDAAGKPTSELGGVRLLARVTGTVLFEKNAVRPMYDRNNKQDLQVIMSAPWLMDLQEDVMAAFAPQGVVVEALKGNSEAIQTSP